MSLPKAVDVRPLDNYCLYVIFNNGEHRVFDMKPYFEHPYFKPLENKAMFRTVRTGGLSVEWANECDIDPEDLYEFSVEVTNA